MDVEDFKTKMDAHARGIAEAANLVARECADKARNAAKARRGGDRVLADAWEQEARLLAGVEGRIRALGAK